MNKPVSYKNRMSANLSPQKRSGYKPAIIDIEKQKQNEIKRLAVYEKSEFLRLKREAREEEKLNPKPNPIKARKEKRAKWLFYKRLVWSITNKQPLTSLPFFMFRGYRNYHLDHIVSIYDGFKYNIPAEWVGHISNLRMIPDKDNMLKAIKSEPRRLAEMLSRLNKT